MANLMRVLGASAACGAVGGRKLEGRFGGGRVGEFPPRQRCGVIVGTRVGPGRGGCMRLGVPCGRRGQVVNTGLSHLVHRAASGRGRAPNRCAAAHIGGAHRRRASMWRAVGASGWGAQAGPITTDITAVTLESIDDSHVACESDVSDDAPPCDERGHGHVHFSDDDAAMSDECRGTICRRSGPTFAGWTASTQTIDSTVHSGAAKVVAPPSFATEHLVKPSAASGNGARYRSVKRRHDRQPLRDEALVDGQLRMITLRSADVTKPWTSAGRIAAKGHRVALGGHDARIEHKLAGRRGKLHKKPTCLC